MAADLKFMAFSSTQITMASGASSFYPIVPILNQVGICFEQVGISGGIEIASGGQSYAPASAGTSFNYINSNGSSLGLKANGSGFPICQQAGVFPSSGYIPGAPFLWLSAGNSCILNIGYWTNDPRPNA